MVTWRYIDLIHPDDNEQILLMITNKETEDKYHTVGYVRNGELWSRGISPCKDLNDAEYVFRWIYLYEVEQLINAQFDDIGPCPGILHGDW